MAWSEGRTSGGASHEQRRSEMLAGVSRIDALLDQVNEWFALLRPHRFFLMMNGHGSLQTRDTKEDVMILWISWCSASFCLLNLNLFVPILMQYFQLLSPRWHVSSAVPFLLLHVYSSRPTRPFSKTCKLLPPNAPLSTGRAHIAWPPM